MSRSPLLKYNPAHEFIRSTMKHKSSVLSAAILAVFLAVPFAKAAATAATTSTTVDVNAPMKEAKQAS
jgi:hypothetical protein